MTYYPTLAEDLIRAKEIIATGKPRDGAALYGKDIHAAYKLLESFVETIEKLLPEVKDGSSKLKNLAILMSACDRCGNTSLDRDDEPVILCQDCDAQYRDLKAQIEWLRTHELNCPHCGERSPVGLEYIK